VIAVLSRIPHPSDRRWLVWILLLALAQALDVLTTRLDIGRGALEGNAMAAGILETGGFWRFLVVKFSLVAAMATAVVLVVRYSAAYPGPRASIAGKVVWRGLQLCVVVLALTGLHNVLVLASIQGWPTPTLLVVLPTAT